MCASGVVNKVSKLRQRGFTLIELMMVVAMVAILASIALPAYSEYIRRGQLPEAFTTLADYRSKMETYFLDHKNYGAAGDCASNASASSWNTFPRTVKYFRYDCELLSEDGTDAMSYRLTATGVDGQAIGHTYTLDKNGIKSTTEFKGATYTGNTCWFSKTAACD
ncbi:MAG: prepilin-type N-terminal cleavage/methylation domain-containing protein [Rubrivivax sp.]|nr:MAG: prepilin-type N-terminal cleavage/methylation domain-containing protein [Rubrivivax sp.]